MAKKRFGKSIQKCAATLVAACLLFTGVETSAVSVKAETLTYYTDTDGTKVASDKNGFVYCIPTNATKKSGTGICMYAGTKADITFPAKCNDYQVTSVGVLDYIGKNTSLSIFDVTLKTVKIPSGYTEIAAYAFQNQKELYRVEIPASVKKIGKKAFSGCDTTKLTIVAPYGSKAEQYAKANGIHYSNSKSLSIETGGTTMYAGESKTIAVMNNKNTVTWKSSNKSVATVSKSGKVTAKKAGTAKITATIAKKTYSYTFTVLARTEANVLKVVCANYVKPQMSDYEKVVAANKWMSANVDPSGTSASAKTALETGKCNYSGYANAYKKILDSFGLSGYGFTVKVINGTRHTENSVKIAGKTYTASTITSASGVNKTYTTTACGKLNKSTMTLSVGKTGTFKLTDNKSKATWKSSNTAVATVSSKGKVTAKSAGTAVITLTTGKTSFSCTVRVN